MIFMPLLLAEESLDFKPSLDKLQFIENAQLLNVNGIDVHIDDHQVLKYQPS